MRRLRYSSGRADFGLHAIWPADDPSVAVLTHRSGAPVHLVRGSVPNAGGLVALGMDTGQTGQTGQRVALPPGAAGWARVLYGDHCEPFVLSAGDCVLQPPGTRHQVLETSAGLEVVEIGCPAEHPTFVEH